MNQFSGCVDACANIDGWRANYDILFIQRGLYEIIYSIVLMATCTLVLIKMDFFKSRTENFSLYTTGFFLIVANMNCLTSLLIVFYYRSETSWTLYLIEAIIGSKWLALWTFIAQYLLVCLILPQLFPL